MTRFDERRGVSSAIAVVLVVALVVVLAGVVGAYAFGFAEDLRDPSPNVAESKGELLANDESRFGDQIVRLTHVAGDSIEVRNVQIVVAVEGRTCTARSRIVDLPANRLNESHVEGDDVFDGRDVELGAIDGEDDGVWSAGEFVRFRIAVGDCELHEGDEVRIRIVHRPTDSILIEETMTAEG